MVQMQAALAIICSHTYAVGRLRSRECGKPYLRKEQLMRQHYRRDGGNRSGEREQDPLGALTIDRDSGG